MCSPRVSTALLVSPLGMQSAALAQMELSVGAGWSTFRGGKVGETTVLVYPQTVLLDVTMNNGLRAGARVTINSRTHFEDFRLLSFGHGAAASSTVARFWNGFGRREKIPLGRLQPVRGTKRALTVANPG
jgi:hypothetical protein